MWDIAREPIAQTFKFGTQFLTVVGNHFKSKSGTDPSPQAGQDAFNDERVEQAQSLLAVRQHPVRGSQERRLPRR